MNPNTHTLDLEDEKELLENQIETIGEREDDLADEANEAERRHTELDEEDEEWLSEEALETEMERLNRSFDSLEARRIRLEGYLDAVDDAIEEWEGTEIVMQELTGQEARMMRDDLRRKAEALGLDNIPDGSHEIELVKKAVVSMPVGAPDPEDVHGLPNRLFDWLHGRANALNTVGRFEVKNSSLRERMTERGSLTSQSR